MDKDLANALVEASKAVHDATKMAREAGREDIAQHLRNAGWDLAAALSVAVADKSKEVES